MLGFGKSQKKAEEPKVEKRDDPMLGSSAGNDTEDDGTIIKSVNPTGVDEYNFVSNEVQYTCQGQTPYIMRKKGTVNNVPYNELPRNTVNENIQVTDYETYAKAAAQQYLDWLYLYRYSEILDEVQIALNNKVVNPLQYVVTKKVNDARNHMTELMLATNCCFKSEFGVMDLLTKKDQLVQEEDSVAEKKENPFSVEKLSCEDKDLRSFMGELAQDNVYMHIDPDTPVDNSQLQRWTVLKTYLFTMKPPKYPPKMTAKWEEDVTGNVLYSMENKDYKSFVVAIMQYGNSSKYEFWALPYSPNHTEIFKNQTPLELKIKIEGISYSAYEDCVSFRKDFDKFLSNPNTTMKSLATFLDKAERLHSEDDAWNGYMRADNPNYDGVYRLMVYIRECFRTMYETMIDGQNVPESNPYRQAYEKFMNEDEGPIIYLDDLEDDNVELRGLQSTCNNNGNNVYHYFERLNDLYNGGVVIGGLYIPEHITIYRPMKMISRYVLETEGENTGIALNGAMPWTKQHSKKGKNTGDLQQGFETVQNDLIRLLKTVGYEALAGKSEIEVSEFTGYKKPDIKDTDVVTMARDSQIEEYNKMASAIQEVRNIIQNGKAVEGKYYTHVVSVEQGERGTYFVIYGAEAENESEREVVHVIAQDEDGKVYVWEKAYSQEPIDFRSDSYFNNEVYMKNDANVSIHFNSMLWEHLLSEKKERPADMIGFFEVTMQLKSN